MGVVELVVAGGRGQIGLRVHVARREDVVGDRPRALKKPRRTMSSNSFLRSASRRVHLEEGDPGAGDALGHQPPVPGVLEAGRGLQQLVVGGADDARGPAPCPRASSPRSRPARAPARAPDRRGRRCSRSGPEAALGLARCSRGSCTCSCSLGLPGDTRRACAASRRSSQPQRKKAPVSRSRRWSAGAANPNQAAPGRSTGWAAGNHRLHHLAVDPGVENRAVAEALDPEHLARERRRRAARRGDGDRLRPHAEPETAGSPRQLRVRWQRHLDLRRLREALPGALLDLDLEDVHGRRADEGGDEAGRGPVVDLVRACRSARSGPRCSTAIRSDRLIAST